MNKRDINLFKAAGGERAKGSKRSPLFYMVALAIVVSVLAIGVAVYFNTKVANTQSTYQAKQQTLANYQLTERQLKSKAETYQSVIKNIQTANAIDGYIAGASKLYPHATADEVLAVKNAIFAFNSDYSVNDPVEGERFTPWDYARIRGDLVADNADTDATEAQRNFFWIALQGLEEAQEKAPDTNVWYGYFRGYMVMVFTGGTTGVGLEAFAEGLNADNTAMNGKAPFMDMEVDGYSYAATQTLYIISNDVTYNIVMCPMKSVFERMFDILDAYATLQMQGLSEDQSIYVRYAVDNVVYLGSSPGESTGDDSEYLQFTLILPKFEGTDTQGLFSGYMQGFRDSVFFEISESITESGQDVGDYYQIPVMLYFRGEY